MKFDFIRTEHERRAFMFSIAVIVLGAVSIVTFVISGGSAIFYLFAILAIVLGFYMTRHVSRGPAQEARPANRRYRKR